jgi:hypothetical protein
MRTCASIWFSETSMTTLQTLVAVCNLPKAEERKTQARSDSMRYCWDFFGRSAIRPHPRRGSPTIQTLCWPSPVVLGKLRPYVLR